MKEIQLSQGKTAKVDDEDFEWLNQWKWYAVFDKGTKSFYARRKGRKLFVSTVVYMAREIAKTKSDMICDHINHDTLDNQKNNLRNVTKSQNSMNRKSSNSNNGLNILGVAKNGNGFIAQITINGKRFRFPTRKNIEDAIQDRKEAEKKHYGEYRSK